MNRDFTPSVKAEVRARAGDRCEVCRLLPIVHVHHRRRRSQGGDNSIDNALGVCLECHTFIHANPADAFDMGWLLHAAPVNLGLKGT